MRSVRLTNQGYDWTAIVEADDGAGGSGIASMAVTQVGAGDAVLRSFDPVAPTTPGGTLYQLDFSLPDIESEDVAVMVAVTDAAGT